MNKKSNTMSKVGVVRAFCGSTSRAQRLKCTSRTLALWSTVRSALFVCEMVDVAFTDFGVLWGGDLLRLAGAAILAQYWWSSVDAWIVRIQQRFDEQ